MAPHHWSFGLATLLLLGLGCTGSLTKTGEQGGDESEGGGLAFDAERDRIELLPFPVRLRRVADVLEVPPDDLLLQPLRDRATELGHHDFAVGVRETPAWDAPRIAAWSSALLPVCESNRVHELYPKFPDDLDELMTAAHGRAPSEEQVEELWTAATDSGSSQERAYVATCLAVLSSLEFVAR